MTVYTLFLYIGIAAVALTAVFGVGHSKLKSEPVMHPMTWLVQYFMGAFLLFSGLVKAVDPLGTAYKMKDYFTEFDAQGLPFMDIMHDNALVFSVFMLVVELVVGAAFLLGIGQRKTTWVNLAMMGFFTFLTGFNYLTGYTPKDTGVGILEFEKWAPVFSDENIRITDCGCFGDFLKLKPIETFSKDIILVILSLFLVLRTSSLKELLPRETKLLGLNLRTLVGTILIVVALGGCLQNYYFDKPMVDFRPFAEGTNLRKAKADCDADQPVVETILVYKNEQTGDKVELNANDLVKPENKYLWEAGSVWKSQGDETKSKVIKEGCNSQIQYFDFPEILERKKASLLVVAGDLTKADKAAFKVISEAAKAAEKDGIKTQALYYYPNETSQVDAFRQEVSAAYPFDTADDKLLKTIVRANPGLLLLQDGKVIGKWHHKHIPDYATIKGMLN